jgi:mRNA interferase RelE/StbE
VASYKIRIKASAAKEIENIEPKKVRRQVIDRIRRLSDDPRPPGCEKLSGHGDRYRVRQGSYRIVYSIADRVLTVFVVKVGHRSIVYRDPS